MIAHADDVGYQLVLGDLALMRSTYPAFEINTLGADAQFGDPVPATEVIRSLMRDGDLTTTTRDGNRIAAFDFEVTSDSYQGLADGEERIMVELDKPNLLTWRLPNNEGPATVFEIVRSWSNFQFEDLSDVRKERVFRVFFECLPYGRSEKLRTIEWTGYAKADPLTSSSGWSTVGGGALTVSGGVLRRSGAAGSSVVAKKTLSLDRFLFIPAKPTNVGATNLAGVTKVTVDGIEVPGPGMFEYYNNHRGHTFDTRQWAGRDASVEITIQAPADGDNTAIYGLWRCGAPPTGAMRTDIHDFITALPATEAHRPLGVDAIKVPGTARCPIHITFTAPAGGAFIYTGPDPAESIRDRGSPEVVFSRFSVAGADGEEIEVSGRLMWFPEGDHATMIGFTDGQPAELFPEGPWPQAQTVVAIEGITTPLDVQYAYPAETKAAITFFQDAGVKHIISPSPALPQGYHGGAAHHEVHVLHPPWSGFAVLDQFGRAIPATITFYPRWRHNAGL